MTENQSQPAEYVPVIVIGGGLAGLTAAAHLTAQGVETVLLDADRLWTGGRLNGGEPEIITHHDRAWSFKPDHGVHAVWGGYLNLVATLERFTTTKLYHSYGEEWINRWGREVRRIEAGNAVRSRWLPAPFHYLNLLFHPQIWATITPLDFLSLPGVLFSILMTVGYDPIGEKSALDGLNMREYFRLWTPNLRATFTGLGTNLLAAAEDDISLSAYIAALRFYTMLRRDAWQMRYFPADSHTALIQPLSDHIEAHGGQIERGATALSMAQTDHGWRISIEDSKFGGVRSVYAQHVIIATNAPAARRLLMAHEDTRAEAEKMIFPEGLRNIVVRLWFKESPVEGTIGGMFTGDFAPDNFFWMHRLYDDYRAWHEATGGSCLEMHFYANPATLDLTDANLIVLATTEAQRAFPELRASFLHATVRRNSKVHTRFRVPTDASLHVETPWPQVFACGDWVGHPTPSLWMERATTTGIAAANGVLEAHGLTPYTLHYPPPPEPLARGLGVIVRGIRWLFKPIISGLRQLRRGMSR